MNSVSNITFTNGTPPLLFYPVPELPAMCHVINGLWNEVVHDPMLASTMRCGQTRCFIPPTNPEVLLTHTQNITGCRFSLMSAQAGHANIDVNIRGNETTTDIHFDGNEIRQIVDMTNPQFHVQWKMDPQNQGAMGEFKFNLNPSTNKYEILFKWGEVSLSGECEAGQKNVLSCTTTGGLLSKWIYGYMTVDIEERIDTSGTKTYSLNILKHSPLPFTSPEEMGRASYSFDEKNGKVAFLAAIKSIDGSPLLNADIAYETDEQGNPTAGNWNLNGFRHETLGNVQSNKIDASYKVNGEPSLSFDLSAEKNDEKKEYSLSYNASAKSPILEQHAMLKMNATLLEAVQKARIELAMISDSSFEPDLKFDYHAQGNFLHQEDSKGDLYEAELADSNGYELATKFREPKSKSIGIQP